MKISVSSGARIHVNSIDMNGGSVRICGGVGFCVQEPRVAVKVSISEHAGVSGPQQHSYLVLEALRRLGMRNQVEVSLESEFGEHIGLGKNTQLELCVLQGLYALAGRSFTPEEAFSFNIGRISGIGLGAFFNGGFVVDGGYSQKMGAVKSLNGQYSDRPAPVIASHSFPKDWHVLLAIPRTVQSLSGIAENDFFHRITPISKQQVYELAYHVVMGVLPALLERDFPSFLRSMQLVCQLGTKPFEEELNSSFCRLLLRHLRSELGFASISSLGPTIYSFSPAKLAIQELERKFQEFTFISTTVSNAPRSVEVMRDNDSVCHKLGYSHKD